VKACINFNFQKALKIKGKGRKREKARQDKAVSVDSWESPSVSGFEDFILEDEDEDL